MAALWGIFAYAKGQYFVAVGVNGHVTIYQGFPGTIAGLATHRTVEETTIAVVDLPLTWREKVETGIRLDQGGLDQAHRTVAELARTSADCLAQRAQRTGTGGDPTGSESTASTNPGQDPTPTNAASTNAASTNAASTNGSPTNAPSTSAVATANPATTAPVQPTSLSPADDGC
jgi:septal ring-binding cell division protein DamX